MTKKTDDKKGHRYRDVQQHLRTGRYQVNFKGSRFECDKDWAESIRSGDVEAERDYRLGDYF